MFKTTTIVIVLATSVLSAEIPSSYAMLEKMAPLPEPGPKTAIKRGAEDLEHPVYKPEEYKNEGRAKIEPVRPIGPIIKHDRMMADQPAEGTTEVNRVDNLALLNQGFIPSPVEVAYPDIPYAPGYGYDSRYPPSNGYDMYGNSPSNYYIEPDTSSFGLLWNQMPDSRTIVSYVGRTISWVFGSIFALLFGSLITVGICSYTNICTIKFNGVGPIHEEMRALVSPDKLEKISHAADFVKNAIDKYQKIQKVTEAIPGARRRRAIML